MGEGMTRDEILAMEAGPELAWKVAELVMGLEVPGMLAVTPDHDSPGGYCVPYTQDPILKCDVIRPVYVAHCACDMDERQPGDDDYWGHYAACLEVVPRYPEDIGPAWEVVEYFGPAPFLLAFHPADAWRTGGGEIYCYSHWSCWFEGGGKIDAKTAPLAICRAALLAVMEVEG